MKKDKVISRNRAESAEFRIALISWFRAYCRSQSPVWGAVRASREIVRFIYPEFKDDLDKIDGLAQSFQETVRSLLRNNKAGVAYSGSPDLSKNFELLSMLCAFCVAEDPGTYSDIDIGCYFKEFGEYYHALSNIESFSGGEAKSSLADSFHEIFRIGSDDQLKGTLYEDKKSKDSPFTDYLISEEEFESIVKRLAEEGRLNYGHPDIPSDNELALMSYDFFKYCPYNIIAIKKYSDKFNLLFMIREAKSEDSVSRIVDRGVLFSNYNDHQAAIGFFYSSEYGRPYRIEVRKGTEHDRTEDYLRNLSDYDAKTEYRKKNKPVRRERAGYKWEEFPDENIEELNPRKPNFEEGISVFWEKRAGEPLRFIKYFPSENDPARFFIANLTEIHYV